MIFCTIFAGIFRLNIITTDLSSAYVSLPDESSSSIRKPRRTCEKRVMKWSRICACALRSSSSEMSSSSASSSTFTRCMTATSFSLRIFSRLASALRAASSLTVSVPIVGYSTPPSTDFHGTTPAMRWRGDCGRIRSDGTAILASLAASSSSSTGTSSAFLPAASFTSPLKFCRFLLNSLRSFAS